MAVLLWFRTRAAWRRRWPSLVAIAVLVAVTLAVALVAVAGARRTHRAPSRFLGEDRTADVIVELRQLGSLQGVSAVVHLPQVLDASVSAAMSSYPYSPTGAFMPVIAPVDGTAGVTAMRGVLQAGRRPDPKSADEILLSEADARTLGARVGGRIGLVAFDEARAQQCLFGDRDHEPPICAKLFRTPRLFVRVVGITRTTADLNNRASDITLAVLSGQFFQRHRTQIAWTPLIAVRLRPGVSSQAFVTAVRRALPAGAAPQFDLPNASATFDAVGVLTTGLWLFALVAGAAGAFAVAQAVARQVRADDDGRALLAGLGCTRRVLFADAVAPIASAALAGTVAAIVGAYLASGLMPVGFARRVEPNPGLAADWVVFLAGAGACVALVGAAAAIAVRAARRRPVSRSSRAVPAVFGYAPPAVHVGLLHAATPGRDARAVPVRSALFGVAAATAGIVGVFGFSAGLTHLVDTPRLYGWTFDVINVNPAYATRVARDPGVAATAVLHAGIQLRIDGRPTIGAAIAPRVGAISPAIVAGRAPQASDEIALGRDTMRATGARIGDSVMVDGVERRLRMRVVGQAVFPTGADAYPLADGAFVAPSALHVIGTGDSNSTLAVRYRYHADRAATFARLDALDASDPTAEPPERPRPPGEIEKLRQVESLPKVLAGFLALLGVLALAHALVVGVRRRARDFAILRAVGFRRHDVRAAVAWESGALALAGAIVGLPFGLVVARLAWARTAGNIGVEVAHQTPVAVVVAVPLAAVVLAVAIASVPARRAARRHPAEVLRSE